MYWTLSHRHNYEEKPKKNLKEVNKSEWMYDRFQNSKETSNYPQNYRSSQQTGVKEPSQGSSNQKVNEFTSSTPTKESKATTLGQGMSPILKENLFNSKSKMTSEEIFAAIHKSKKKLNLKEDSENRCESPNSFSLSPEGSEKSFSNDCRQRSSWSPNTCDLDVKVNEARTRKSWIGTGTPINSFKKLLLQQGVKSPQSKDFKISAVEQLKLSKQDGKIVKQETKASPRMMMNRGRNQWRFPSPRTDVLSSTILEDCNEVEKPEESSMYRKEWERSSPRFARSIGLDSGNLAKVTDSSESRKEASKPKENKSLEITKKYLQQARKNFFSEPASPNVVGLPSPSVKKQLNYPDNGFRFNKSNSTISSPPSLQEKLSKNYVNSSERRKSPIISLETAL